MICVVAPNGSGGNEYTHNIFLKLQTVFSEMYLYENVIKYGTTKYLHLDFGTSDIDYSIKFLKDIKSDGIEIILSSYDPDRWYFIKKLVENKCVDKLVLWDKRWKNMFDVNTYISDYICNENLYGTSSRKYIHKVCTFGGKNTWAFERKYPSDIVYIENISTLKQLYQEVQKYNGCYVKDDGNDANKKIMRWNKAKAIEVLMTGRNAYCDEYINTINYNHFIKKSCDYSKILPIEFEQQEIFNINNDVSRKFIDFLLS